MIVILRALGLRGRAAMQIELGLSLGSSRSRSLRPLRIFGVNRAWRGLRARRNLGLRRHGTHGRDKRPRRNRRIIVRAASNAESGKLFKQVLARGRGCRL